MILAKKIITFLILIPFIQLYSQGSKHFYAFEIADSIPVYSMDLNCEPKDTIRHKIAFSNYDLSVCFLDCRGAGFLKFYSNNKVFAEGYYINSPDSLRKIFQLPVAENPDTTIIESVPLYKPIKDGKWKYYLPNGRIFITEYYVNGKLIKE